MTKSATEVEVSFQFDDEGYSNYAEGYVAALREHTNGEFDEEIAKQHLRDAVGQYSEVEGL